MGQKLQRGRKTVPCKNFVLSNQISVTVQYNKGESQRYNRYHQYLDIAILNRGAQNHCVVFCCYLAYIGSRVASAGGQPRRRLTSSWAFRPAAVKSILTWPEWWATGCCTARIWWRHKWWWQCSAWTTWAEHHTVRECSKREKRASSNKGQ